MQWLEAMHTRMVEHPSRAGLYSFVALTVLTLALVLADHAVQPQSFPVRNLSIEGDFRQVSEPVLAAAVMDTVRGNFYMLDLEAIRHHAESVPWVHRATVRRSWPDGVHIRFTEQQLVARWGRRAWLNEQGQVVDLKDQSGPTGLPLLTGPDGHSERVLDHYRRLAATLEPVGLQIAQLTLSARHSWSIVLDNGIHLTLGRELPEPKVARFARVYRNVFAAPAGKARRVDLRYTNGFTVEWANRTNAVREADVITTGFNEG